MGPRFSQLFLTRTTRVRLENRLGRSYHEDMGKILAMVLVVAACSTTPNTVPGDDYSVLWSDGANRTGTVACGETISHPCPWLLFAYELDVDQAAQAVTWHAAGGTDLNGYPAEHRAPVTEPYALVDGAIELDERADDGGLRHAATLTRTASGWAGDVVWSLFNVAGHTTFHVSIER